MGRVFIDESTLTAIGDAIRNKTGGEDLISPGNFAYEITNLPSGGGEAPEPIVLTGGCAYACAGKLSGPYIELLGDTISTNDIVSAANMFENNTASYIPFEINFNDSSSGHALSNMFNYCINLLEAPTLNNVKPNDVGNMFADCRMIRYFPENYGADWDWSKMNSATSSYSFKSNSIFKNCYSLRKAPMDLLKNYNPKVTYTYSIYYGAFSSCYSLDEIVDLPVQQATFDSNAFTNFVFSCYRLKRLTFATDNGKPYTANWKNQFIDLRNRVGFYGDNFNKTTDVTGYNSGITDDKLVAADAEYQKLKNDNDWFTTFTDYSRYNHDSAVETLRSLPDTSAYGTNTIAFFGYIGSKTDGGAINTLTEEEIAIAAVKGWTVSLV